MTILSGRLAGLAGVMFALMLALEPASAAPASAFGREVKVAEARDGYVGQAGRRPAAWAGRHAGDGNGHKLPANQEFQLVWRTVKGSWKVADHEYHGRKYAPVAYEIAKVRSDAAAGSARASPRPRISASRTTSSCSRATGCSRRSASRST